MPSPRPFIPRVLEPDERAPLAFRLRGGNADDKSRAATERISGLLIWAETMEAVTVIGPPSVLHNQRLMAKTA